MRARGRPRRVSSAMRDALAESAPRTPLAAVQSSWSRAVGPEAARQAEPVAERDGTVTIACRSATWAQELDLMQDRIRERLNAVLAEDAAAAGTQIEVTNLRFTADAARHGRLP